MTVKVMTLAVATTPGATLVDGVGDEVIYFFGFSVLLILLVIAWSSTSVSDHSVFRAAVLVIERRRRSSPDRRRPVPSNVNPITAESTTNESSAAASTLPTSGDEVINETPIRPTCEINENTKQDGDGTGTSSALRQRTSEQPTDTVVVHEDGGQIRVRLKFLNDTQKEVSARLEDQLGHFKRCHFGDELSDNKVVRLIFNGQLLQRDQETLRHYGLVDNCVVHCHISSTPIANRTPTAGTTLLQQQGGGHLPPQVELDLSRLMLPLFGLILGLIWCCRIQYRQYFNTTSTFALLCITGLFVVSVVAICMPTRNHLHQ